MKNYQDLMQDILTHGVDEMDRTGVGTRSVVGRMIQFDMADGFPATTTKTLAWKAVRGELLWFMNGFTNVETLRTMTYGVGSSTKTIWDDNFNNQGVALGYTDGELGPVYGKQWRDFNGVDQLAKAIERIKTNPECRRNIVSAWNPVDLPHMALPPCHVLFRFSVKAGRLNLTWYQRSVDTFLGLAFNIASYGLLLEIVAKITGYKAGLLTGMLDDVHVYNNHFEQVREQLSREPYELPKLVFKKDFTTLEEACNLSVDDIQLEDYKCHSAIKAPMAV
ncbi:dTMP synthase [Aeromonas phage phiAS5]|uniref:thymidylate synthase n=1 Tax=Aeromonas phage phiAS5 TaxID=879630 RepID=E1A2J8_9CAUD|nr:thymidylate synthase [Aeromonas phage phiAS5]ADM79944.1 dTMP synthase [Aeromonas phage phiAS5]